MVRYCELVAALKFLTTYKKSGHLYTAGRLNCWKIMALIRNRNIFLGNSPWPEARKKSDIVLRFSPLNVLSAVSGNTFSGCWRCV